MKNIYNKQFVKSLFNEMASSYELMNYVTSFGFSIIWRRNFINKINSNKASLNVLDMMSGLGENWSFIKKKFPNATVYGIDFSEKMVESSLEKAVKLNIPTEHIHCEDVFENTLASHSFDHIFCAFGLKTLNEHQIMDLIAEMKRLLKANGSFSFIEISVPQNRVLFVFYRFYLAYIIPILGKLFLGNPENYRMLWTYTEKYQNSDEVIRMFKQEGFQINKASYFFGCASGLYGKIII